MSHFLHQSWPWYFSGALIAAIMVLLLFYGKSFGFSSNLRAICAACGAGKRVKFFNYDWKSQRWNLLFLLGSVIGGFISSQWLKNDQPLELSPSTIRDLAALGIVFDGELNPDRLFSFSALRSPVLVLTLLAGGLLIGFGTRYAGGCTSGHAISGLSNLQLPSLIAVCGFFAGGLIMTHLIFPWLLPLL
jgi:uncharacterized protein